MKFALLAISLIILWTAPREEKVFFLPTANAGADRQVLVIGSASGNPNSQTLLDGSASTGTGLTYAWTKISGPASATDTIYKANSAKAPVARFDKTGAYTYKLTVTDNSSNIAVDTVVITATSSPTLINPAGALIIKQIACCEYSTNYLTSDNKIFQVAFNGSAKMYGMYGYLGTPVQISGGQYWGGMCDDLGYAFIVVHNTYFNMLKWVPVDSSGALFDSVNFTQSYISSDFYLRNGKLYVGGTDRMGWYGPLGTPISKPLAVPMPAGGLYYTKITVSEGGVVGLANDGTVWQHRVNNKTPVQITGLPRAAIDICSERKGAHIAIVPDAGQPTNSGQPYGWGLTQYIGGSSGTTTSAVDYRSIWNIHDGSNNIIPIKFLAATDNSMHPIDTLGHMWGIGLNGGGEVGNGSELCNHAEQWATPYAWNWTAGAFVTPAVDITPPATTFKKVFGGNTLGFGYAALDQNDTLWVGGRDKSFELGTMRSMLDGGNARPNMLDILAPFKLAPSPLYRTLVNIPVTIYTCNAGANQSISATNTTLNGAAMPTAGYSFTGYKWTQLSGPNTGTFGSSTALTTSFTGLVTGTYTLKLLATDNNTATIADTLQVIVNATTPPVVTILPSPVTITEPASSVSLLGSATTSGGATITSWLWFRRSGNTVYNITSPTSQNTTITGLQPGTYVFELDATDSNGNTGTTQVTVNVLRYPDKVIIRKHSFHHKIIAQ